jgi:glycosyltransferase involved in cell wall biosynthesis/LmbE family N-acetylglucosaminyl deacetylase
MHTVANLCNAGEKVLVLTHESRAAAIRAQAPDATVLVDSRGLSTLEGEFDKAFIDGLLEHERWDRWLLQRVHRLLRSDARLVVAVPRLLSPGSVVDRQFLAYVSRKLGERAFDRRPARFRAPGTTYRRYHIPSLARKMASVGFTGIEAEPRHLARKAVLRARKGPSLAGIAGDKLPDAQLHGRWFSEQYVAMQSARNAWLSRFPEYRTHVARALDPSDWRGARVLVLAPHPDDELVGCGGTLCRLISAGAELAILQATDGAELASLEGLPEASRRAVRLEEAARVAAALGAKLFLWRERDQALRCSDATIHRLAALLDEVRPTHVFTPFLGDVHADHRSLSHILARALAVASVEPQVLQYEVWSLVPADLYCDVTDCAEKLEALLLLYEQAMTVDDFVHVCESRNLARGRELTGRPCYVEAFLSSTSKEYQRLALSAEAAGDTVASVASASPKVSVVMPVFNAERYLGEAIQSILDQTYQNFEIIVVDDCSTDRSPEMVARFSDPRIRLFVNEKNRGIAYTRNRGLRLATGELIATMDADDISLPARFARQVRQFALDPDLVLCATNGVAVSENGARISGPFYAGSEDVAWSVLFYCPIPHSSAMLRASRMSGLAYPNTPAEDIGLWRELLGRGNFSRLREVLLKYRVHDDSDYAAKRAAHERAALEGAHALFVELVGEDDASALLFLTRHYAESGVRLPPCTLPQLERAGAALVRAYCRSFPSSQDARPLASDLRLRIFWYCFRRQGRFDSRSVAYRIAAGSVEWIRSLGAFSLLMVAARFIVLRLQRGAARALYRDSRAGAPHHFRSRDGGFVARHLRTEE